MKAILISIKPKWVAKILNGEKTIVVRKSMPKCDLPIDVYIYCTKEQGLARISKISKDRYICEKDLDLKNDFKYMSSSYDGSGKVVAKFTLNKVEEINKYPSYYKICGFYYTPNLSWDKLEKASYLSFNELNDYLKAKTGYAWHISNLVIFDEPKELSEFYKVGYLEALENSLKAKPFPISSHFILNQYLLRKAPQSWCYVEVDQTLK